MYPLGCIESARNQTKSADERAFFKHASFSLLRQIAEFSRKGLIEQITEFSRKVSLYLHEYNPLPFFKLFLSLSFSLFLFDSFFSYRFRACQRRRRRRNLRGRKHLPTFCWYSSNRGAGGRYHRISHRGVLTLVASCQRRCRRRGRRQEQLPGIIFLFCFGFLRSSSFGNVQVYESSTLGLL